jgi:hypothetical protein
LVNPTDHVFLVAMNFFIRGGTNCTALHHFLRRIESQIIVDEPERQAGRMASPWLPRAQECARKGDADLTVMALIGTWGPRFPDVAFEEAVKYSGERMFNS